MPAAASGPAPRSVKKKPIPWFKPARAAPSTIRQVINSMIVLPILIPLIFVRGPDVLFFNDIWCDRVGGPMPIFMAALSVALALLKLASRRPGQALIITVALFAWVKQLADGSVPPPAVPGHYSGTVSPMTTLVTGANSGVGYAVALELARSGHTVLLACRSTAKCDAAREKLLLTLGDEMVGRHTFSRPDMVDLLEEEAARQLLQGEWSTNEQWEADEETEDEEGDDEEDEDEDEEGGDEEDGNEEEEDEDEFAERAAKKKASTLSSRAARRKVPPDHRTKAWLSKQARLLNKSRQASQEVSQRIVSLGGMDLSSVSGMDAFAAGPVAQAVQSAAASLALQGDVSNNKSKNRSGNTKRHIDLLVLNAGYVPMPSSIPCVGGGGWECGLGDMHLGHFAFVQRLAAQGLIANGGGDNDQSNNTSKHATTQSSGTTCLVVASDIARLGGFHSSLLGALDAATDNNHQKGSAADASTAAGSAVNPGGEGDLRSEITVGAGPYSLARAPGILNAWALLPDHVSGGAYARAKLANVLFARELERRGIVQSAVSVHPGTVYTDIVNLEGMLGALQRAISPLLLRTPQAAANVVLSSVYGPQGVKAYGDAKREAHAAEIASQAAKAAAVSARQRVAAVSSSASSSADANSNGEASEDAQAAAKEAAAHARAAYEDWQTLENALPPAVRASKSPPAASTAPPGATSKTTNARTLMQTPSAAAAADMKRGDPWLHFANGRGQVLGPSALALKSVSRTDQLARALWAASELALHRELNSF